MKKMMIITAVLAMALVATATEIKTFSGTLKGTEQDGQLEQLQVQVSKGVYVNLGKAGKNFDRSVVEGLAIGDQVEGEVEGSVHPKNPNIFLGKTGLKIKKK